MNKAIKEYLADFFKDATLYGKPIDVVAIREAPDKQGDAWVYVGSTDIVDVLQFPQDWTPPPLPIVVEEPSQ